MKVLWGYNELSELLKVKPSLLKGIVVDTNVLISISYDFDNFYEQTNELLELLIENKIPLFCNVNVRSEFLEIQRRIIFTEALLSFEAEVDKASLPVELSRKLSSIRANQRKRELDERNPFRLSEAEIKGFKNLMIKLRGPSGNLWLAFCRELIGDQLANLWEATADRVGLNFLSSRIEDQQKYISTPLDWTEAVRFMSTEGISSADAMIANMYFSSNFEAILSSDSDIGIVVLRRGDGNKLCLLPDLVARSIFVA